MPTFLTGLGVTAVLIALTAILFQVSQITAVEHAPTQASVHVYEQPAKAARSSGSGEQLSQRTGER